MEVNLLYLGYEFQKLCLTTAINNLSYIIAGEMTCLVNLKFVGIYIIYAVFLQNLHQAVNTLGEWKVLCNVAHHADIKSLEQLTTSGE